MLAREVNIPDYIENPYTKHENNTLLFLKEVFFGYPSVIFLAESETDYQDYDTRNLSNVLLAAAALEEKGYTVWVAEGIDCEYSGSIWLWKDGSGKFKCRGSKKRDYRFRDFEGIKDIIERIIVRRVDSFLQQTEFNGVQMDFGWSKYFLGKFNERIVFFDYAKLENNA